MTFVSDETKKDGAKVGKKKEETEEEIKKRQSREANGIKLVKGAKAWVIRNRTDLDPVPKDSADVPFDIVEAEFLGYDGKEHDLSFGDGRHNQWPPEWVDIPAEEGDSYVFASKAAAEKGLLNAEREILEPLARQQAVHADIIIRLVGKDGPAWIDESSSRQLLVMAIALGHKKPAGGEGSQRAMVKQWLEELKSKKVDGKVLDHIMLAKAIKEKVEKRWGKLPESEVKEKKETKKETPKATKKGK